MEDEGSEQTVCLEADATDPEPLPIDSDLPRIIGRYRVTGLLGEGGMATVLAAEDVELRRRVAIKLLSPRRDHGSTDDGSARLLTEARAMAKLSHPGIVRIFDVGRVGERVFIAMELIAGQTLRAWLESEARAWTDVLAMFEQAGRGLSAAHDAGVVHRDFKPSNVMVSRNGQARVLDFGLAKPGGAPLPASEDVVTQRGGDDEGGSTRTGVVMGTPRYMAPEQHFGRHVGPAADQYAFCLALYEALSGGRAFPSASLLETAQAKERAAPPRPRATAVPLRVWLAIERGLHPDPGARWPSMNALLAAMHTQPPRRVVPVFVAGAIVSVGIGALAVQDPAPVPCTTEMSTAALGGAWNPSRRAAVEHVLVTTDTTIGPDQWARAHARLDRYARDWIAAHHDACRALVDGDTGAPLHDRRMACLQRRRASLASAAVVLSNLDAANLSRATSITASLPAVEACGADEYLAQRIFLPDDPAQRATAEHIREGLAQAQSLEVAGDIATALHRVDQALAAARSLDHRPVLAEALVLAADIYAIAGRHHDAARLGEEATWVAELAQHHHAAATAAIQRAYQAESAADYETGLTWAARARDAAARLGPDDVLAANIEQGTGVLLLRAGRLDEAQRAIEHALDLQLRALPEGHHDLASTHANLALLHITRADYSTAERHSRAAVAIFEAALGPDHPGLASKLEGLGAVQFYRGDFAGAEVSFRRALANHERVPGDRADAAARSAFARGERTRRAHGEEHPVSIDALVGLGEALLAQARAADAIEPLQAAARLALASPGADPEDLARYQGLLARALDESGRAEIPPGADHGE